MVNNNRSHRLTSSAFERTDDLHKIAPKRVIFLSVEGVNTEPSYFECLNRHLDNSIIKIEVLRRTKLDGYSDPKQVIELLEEYLELRDGDIVPEYIQDLLGEKYDHKFIKHYLETDNQKLNKEQIEFREELLKLKIDIDYRNYLSQFNQEGDCFGVVIDRDQGSHPRQSLEDCLRHCQSKKIDFYITNPCFEFWLLMHICDIKQSYNKEELDEFLKNPRVSKNHTQVSREVSKLANHAKKISVQVFEDMYFPNIKRAIEQANDFETELPVLFDKLGTNLPELLKKMGIH